MADLNKDSGNQLLEVPSTSFDWISLSLGILALFLVITALVLNYILKRDAQAGPTGPAGPARGATGFTGPTGIAGIPGANGTGNLPLKLKFDTVAPASGSVVQLGGDDGPSLANSFFLLTDSGGTIDLQLDPKFNFGSFLFLSADQQSRTTTIESSVYFQNNDNKQLFRYSLAPNKVLLLIPFFDSTQPENRLLALQLRAQN
jgi:hypothetical protein